MTWHVDVSASDAGMLVYGGVGPGSRQLVWLDRSTYAQTGVAVDGLSRLFLVRLSPRGDRMVFQKDPEGRDISVYDLRNKTTVMSVPRLHSNLFPAWSPDGKWIAYGSSRDGQFQIYRMSADGNGKERKLLSDTQRIMPADWNGSNLLYFRGGLGNEFECWVLSLENGRKRRVLESADDCRFSPDGQWLAYAAHEGPPSSTSPGPLQIYVMNFTSGRGKYKVSEKSGIGTTMEPGWERTLLPRAKHPVSCASGGQFFQRRSAFSRIRQKQAQHTGGTCLRSVS